MPENFGSYKILSVLGSGGMGTVYKAKDTQRRTVALKVMSPELLEDRIALYRFSQEPNMHVLHPNIVEVYDSGKIDGYPYFAMQFIEGKSLSLMLAEQGRMTPLQLSPILNDLASALDAIHKNGIVHRDVKPSNVLVESGKRTGKAYLFDFGVAVQNKAHTAPTPAGVRAGTPRYMSPEQAKRQVATPQSDVYSLGVVAFEMLAGRPPFEGNNDTRIMELHQTELPPNLRTLNPHIPIHIANTISRALSKDPDLRYRSAGEFAIAFERAIKANPLFVGATGGGGNRRVLMGALAAVMLVLAALLGVLGWNVQQQKAAADANATSTVVAADTATALASEPIADTPVLSDTLPVTTQEPTPTLVPSNTPRPSRTPLPTRTATATPRAPTQTPVPVPTATLKG